MNRRSSPVPISSLNVESLEDRCVLSSAEFVNGLYHDILHRTPAAAEVAAWTAVVNEGTNPQRVARS